MLGPCSVDGLIIAGTVILLAGSLLGWLCVAPGIAATLYANVMSGVGHGPVSATVAAWPAAAFALASFTLERWLKTRARPAVTSGPAAADVAGHPAGQVAEPGPVTSPETVTAAPGGDAPGAVQPPATEVAGQVVADQPPPAGIQPPPDGCGHEPTGDTERDVQLAYLHARDCLGDEPSIRQLSAASGLSRYKVAELTKDLNGHKTLQDISGPA
jgi:hypothetical protein